MSLAMSFSDGISSGSIPHPSEDDNEVSENGFEYNQQYEQRIRELGQASKESWIKRIWNHMFGANKVLYSLISYSLVSCYESYMHRIASG